MPLSEHPIDRRTLPVPDRRAVDVRDQRDPRGAPVPVSAPDGAPNVVVVLIDDMGFGVSSAFGGPVRMPAAERLAGGGLSYTRFHTTGVCSPTRASLLTGRNAHAVGMGTIPDTSTDVPGYSAIRPDSAATIAEVLRENGYATGAFGKMHVTPPAEMSPAGPFDRWPTGEGFERFYGFLGGETGQYYPTLTDGTTPIEPPASPEEGYHLSEDLVDQAIEWITHHEALTPEKPFFAYVAFGATHSPLHVRPDWVDPYRGRFDQGWEHERELTLARQKELGVVPADARLSPWPASHPAWDELSDVERHAAAMLMELYAGCAEHTDAQVGRLVDALEQQGLLDTTMFLYILGDNGASAEAGVVGTTNEWRWINGFGDNAERTVDMGRDLGGPASWAGLPSGWALAMDTPYQWYKAIASHYGATRNPLIVHWPQRLQGHLEPPLRHQWHHVNDVVPTILEAAGIPAPHTVNGVAQQPLDGVSMYYSLLEPDASDRHITQYFEFLGNRAVYHEGWIACARHVTMVIESLGTDEPRYQDDSWELYDTRSDWTQAEDLAEVHPDKLAELQQLFLVEAARNQVLPLDDRLLRNLIPELAGRRDITSGRRSVTYPGSMPWLSPHAVPDVRNRSHQITAGVRLAPSASRGVIATQGSLAGGWSIYLHDGCLTYCHNVAGLYFGIVRSSTLLSEGWHEVRMELDYDGGGMGRGAAVRLLADGAVVGSGRIDRTTPISFGIDPFTMGRTHGMPAAPDYGPGPASHLDGEVAWVRIEVEERSSDRDLGRPKSAFATH